jgi:hypothetical protein
VLDVAGQDVEATVLGVEEDGARIDLDVRLDGQASGEVHLFGRDEYLGIVHIPETETQ